MQWWYIIGRRNPLGDMMKNRIKEIAWGMVSIFTISLFIAFIYINVKFAFTWLQWFITKTIIDCLLGN